MAVDINAWKVSRSTKLKLIERSRIAYDVMKGNKPVKGLGPIPSARIGLAFGASYAVEQLYENWDTTKDYWLKAFGVNEPKKTSVPLVNTAVNKKEKVPTLPADSKVNKTLEEVMNENTTTFNKNIEKLIEAQNADVVAISAINEALGERFNDAPLLQNQIYLKEALDNIGNRLLEQSATMATALQVLDSHLLVISTSLKSLSNSQITKVNDNRIIASQNDYGDSDFFYTFNPTSSYWHDVDLADYQLQLDTLGVPPAYYSPPSATFAPLEIGLIDSMEGSSTKKEIRSAIESFRKTNVSTDVRAKLGSVTSSATMSQIEANKAQTDYYKVATPAVQTKIENDTALVEGTNALVTATQALQGVDANGNATTGAESLVPHLAKIAEWAESAKVVSDHAQTVREVRDLDGDVIASISPMALEASKNVALARGETDTNKIGGDLLNPLEEIFDGDAMNLLKIFSYFPVTASTSNLGDTDEFQQLLETWKGANQ